MCGIEVSVNSLFECPISTRGPNGEHSVVRFVRGHCLRFRGTLLHLRGEKTLQPVCNSNVLLWNGEVYNNSAECDTLFVLNHISDLSEAEMVRFFETLEAEYAFIFFSAIEETLYFGRDFLGRRSLTLIQGQDTLVVGSVGCANEVSSRGIYKYKLGGSLDLIPWEKHTFKWFEHTQTIDFNLILFYNVLFGAVKMRIGNMLPSSGFAILFSGGVDCTVLAILAHLALEVDSEIELINVSFSLDAADLKNARMALKELQKVAPERRWILNEVFVSNDEAKEHKQAILDLMSPCNKVMDYSISLPFYFAAKSCTQPVLISGLGADELLGGYRRHAVCLDRNGPEALFIELQEDLYRISERNLGRDDRIMGAFGHEVRYPYLDNNFMEYCLALPMESKVNTENKHALRELARYLGLIDTADREKRAVQFGSGSAKMEKIKGHKNGRGQLEIK